MNGNYWIDQIAPKRPQPRQYAILVRAAEEARPIAAQGLELEPDVRIGELFDRILFHRGLMTELMEGARILGLPE